MRPARAAYLGRCGRAAVVTSCMAIEVRLAQIVLLLQGSELPMWRYIDPAGACQGPFESMEMMKWFEGAFLNASLLICGTVGGNTSGLLTRICMLPGLFRVPSWSCAVATYPAASWSTAVLLGPLCKTQPLCWSTSAHVSVPSFMHTAADLPALPFSRPPQLGAGQASPQTGWCSLLQGCNMLPPKIAVVL